MRNMFLTPAELSKIGEPVSRGAMAGKLCEILSSREINEGQFSLNETWGVELAVREDLAGVFLDNFFGAAALPPTVAENSFGPKILAIEGGGKLSWHIHERKDAFLRVLTGRLDVYKSPTDEQVEPVTAEAGELIHIPKMIRHRLGSVIGWSLVAEISRNVFPENPSNEAGF